MMADGLARVCLACVALTAACARGDRARTDGGATDATSSSDGAGLAKCTGDRVWPSIIVRARATQTNALLVIGQWAGGGVVKRGLLRDDGAAGFCPIATPAPLAEFLPGRGGQIWGSSEGAVSILVSSDDGKSWQDAWDATLGAPRRLLGSTTTDELWATLADGTLVLTRNRGKSWARVISPGDPRVEPGAYIFDAKATLDPQHPGRVYLTHMKFNSTGEQQFAIVRSDDFGATFHNLTSPDPKIMAGSLGVDGGGTLFLLSVPKLWKSTDAGQTWSALPALASIDPGVSIVSTKKDHLVLLADFLSRAWESTDGGTSFQKVEFPGDPSRVHLLLAGTQPGHFSAWSPRGLEQTQDRGVTWNVAFASPTGAAALTFTGDARQRLLAAGTDGLARSDDQGRTFTSQRTPWKTPLLKLFAVSSGDLYCRHHRRCVSQRRSRGDVDVDPQCAVGRAVPPR